MEVWLLYNVVLASIAQQNESAIHTQISPPCHVLFNILPPAGSTQLSALQAVKRGGSGERTEALEPSAQCGPQTNSSSINWELVRNAYSWAPPQTY